MFRSAGPGIAAATLAVAALTASAASAQPARPNVVIMYADNLGYGEVGIYGGVRGVPTPRLDALAREGLRLTNFNVETFCTPSRTALLTGRYGIRSGTLAYRLPVTGMTLWEITIAEYLQPFNPWVISAIDVIVKNFWATVYRYPLIPVGAPDPYAPPSR